MALAVSALGQADYKAGAGAGSAGVTDTPFEFVVNQVINDMQAQSAATRAPGSGKEGIKDLLFCLGRHPAAVIAIDDGDALVGPDVDLNLPF